MYVPCHTGCCWCPGSGHCRTLLRTAEPADWLGMDRISDRSPAIEFSIRPDIMFSIRPDTEFVIYTAGYVIQQIYSIQYQL